MPQKKHKPEEIVAKLRQVDVLLSQGRPGGRLQNRNGKRQTNASIRCWAVLVQEKKSVYAAVN